MLIWNRIEYRCSSILRKAASIRHKEQALKCNEKYCISKADASGSSSDSRASLLDKLKLQAICDANIFHFKG